MQLTYQSTIHLCTHPSTYHLFMCHGLINSSSILHPSLSTPMSIHHPLVPLLSHLLTHPSIIHTIPHPSTWPLVSNSSIMCACMYVYVCSPTHLSPYLFYGHPSIVYPLIYSCSHLLTLSLSIILYSYHPSYFQSSIHLPIHHPFIHAFIQSTFPHSIHPIFKTHRLNNNHSSNVSTGSSI